MDISIIVRPSVLSQIAKVHFHLTTCQVKKKNQICVLKYAENMMYDHKAGMTCALHVS